VSLEVACPVGSAWHVDLPQRTLQSFSLNSACHLTWKDSKCVISDTVESDTLYLQVIPVLFQ